MGKAKLFALFALSLLLLTACGSGTPAPANITIHMNEYTYEPNTIELKVGQQVTITLINDGTLDHELMIGRLVVNNDQGQPSGFSTDFFANAGVTPTVSGGGMLMDHNDEGGMDMGAMDNMNGDSGDAMDNMNSDSGDDMDNMNSDSGEAMGDMAAESMAVNMVMQPVGSDPTTVSFTVTEDMVGNWTFACFQQDGVHYTSGMTGELVVTE